MNSTKIIATDNHQALNDFRAMHLSAENILRIHKSSSAFTLIDPPVGIGKSESIDASIPYFLDSGYADLIFVLAPTHDLLRERRLLHENPQNIAYRYIQRRPESACGPNRNAQWQMLEKQQMSLLGKETICAHCPQHPCCAWPNQLGASLREVKVIFAPQAYLNIMPSFILHTQQSVGVKRSLVLLDEVDFSKASLRKKINAHDIEKYTHVLERILGTAEHAARITNALESKLNILRSMSQCDKAQLIQEARKKIQLPPNVSIEIQSCGLNMYGEQFRYLGYDLELFTHSSRKSWEFTFGGGMEFCVRPWLGRDVLIYSSTASPALLSHRLGHEVKAAFPEYVFRHGQTVWYNIRATLGMSSYFRHNAEQIIYIFAYLIVLRTNQGKRALLICKKAHRDTCITQINALFCRLGYTELHALKAQDWIASPEDVRKKAIPVLHYGIIGVNDFADFDCAYCLMGYYLPTHAVSDYFQELYPTRRRIPITVTSSEYPPYRVVEPVNSRDAIYTDYLRLGQQVVQQEELGTVMQTVGRVRPFTKPREIITFQCGLIPGVVYDQEFTSLEDVRRYFGIKTARTMADMDRYAQVQSLKAQGYTQHDISGVLNISRSTVQRKWQNAPPKGITNPIILL